MLIFWFLSLSRLYPILNQTQIKSYRKHNEKWNCFKAPLSLEEPFPPLWCARMFIILSGKGSYYPEAVQKLEKIDKICGTQKYASWFLFSIFPLT